MPIAIASPPRDMMLTVTFDSAISKKTPRMVSGRDTTTSTDIRKLLRYAHRVINARIPPWVASWARFLIVLRIKTEWS
ncbi:MAG: hypothetical protein BWY49_00729 [Candidatus Omnitrophica bacterium ADurb.Bin314]|nr:MAG: hypothetical protein BWY49_00729 [Candidatus Omnitrophica bacterium ADurb.Bin314]